jgi:hypothetical protein
MHLRKKDLERYALGTLPPSAIQGFELHLLVCQSCQDRLAEMDVFVAAMRLACAEVESTSDRKGSRRLALIERKRILRRIGSHPAGAAVTNIAFC